MAGVRGVELYWTAKALADRDEWMESIRISFDAKIVARIERLVEISEACEVELIRRVPKGEA